MARSNDQATQAGADGRSRGVQSVDIAFRLLHLLAAANGPVSLKKLSDAAGMPASKAHRYLASLAAAGLVTQTHRSGHYDLGRGALDIGLAAMARLDFVNSAAGAMADLVEQTGATALLAVWGTRGPTIVRWERSRNFIVTALGLGTIMPLLNSATGRVFLTWLPKQLTVDILAEEMGRQASTGLFRNRQVAGIIEDVRRHGFASVDGRFIPGLSAVSAPVLNWQGGIEAAITLISTDAALIEPDGDAIARLLETCREQSVTRPAAGG